MDTRLIHFDHIMGARSTTRAGNRVHVIVKVVILREGTHSEIWRYQNEDWAELQRPLGAYNSRADTPNCRAVLIGRQRLEACLHFLALPHAEAIESFHSRRADNCLGIVS